MAISCFAQPVVMSMKLVYVMVPFLVTLKWQLSGGFESGVIGLPIELPLMQIMEELFR